MREIIFLIYMALSMSAMYLIRYTGGDFFPLLWILILSLSLITAGIGIYNTNEEEE